MASEVGIFFITQDEETLNRVKDDQRRIREECIVDNLTAVILHKGQVFMT